MTKQKIAFSVNIKPEDGMVQVGCFAQHDATVTLDGVEYKGAIIVQSDERGTVDFPGLPQNALNIVRWVPYWVSEKLADMGSVDGLYDAETLECNAGYLLDEFQSELSEQLDGEEDFELA